MISMYNQKPEDMYPIRNLMRIVANRLTIEGFIVGDERFGPKYQKEHQQKLQQWLADGSFKAKTDVIEGIDKAADGLIGLFQGHNFGKLVLQIAKLDT